jgi:hypothetical protein
MDDYPRQLGSGWSLHYDSEKKMPFIHNSEQSITYWTNDEWKLGWCKPPHRFGEESTFLNVFTNEVVSGNHPPLRRKRKRMLVDGVLDVSDSDSDSGGDNKNVTKAPDHPPLKRKQERKERQQHHQHPATHSPTNTNRHSNWFQHFLDQTQTHSLAHLFLENDCQDFNTLKLFQDDDFKQIGIMKKGTRVRILDFLQYLKTSKNSIADSAPVDVPTDVWTKHESKSNPGKFFEFNKSTGEKRWSTHSLTLPLSSSSFSLSPLSGSRSSSSSSSSTCSSSSSSSSTCSSSSSSSSSIGNSSRNSSNTTNKNHQQSKKKRVE